MFWGFISSHYQWKHYITNLLDMKVLSTGIYTWVHAGTCQEKCSTRRHPEFSMNRKRWTESQIEILKKSYQANIYPKNKELDLLSNSLNTSRKRIENWFCFKRFKETRDGKLTVGE